MSNIPTPHEHAGEPGDDRPGVHARLRVARPQPTRATLDARIARAARVLNGWLVFAVAANAMVFGVEGVPVGHRVVGAMVAGFVFLAAYRLERRNVTFARLSGLAQAVYRAKAVLLGVLVLGSVAWFVPALQLQPRRVLLTGAAVAIVAALWSALTRRLLGGRRVHRTLLIGDGERVGRFVAEFAADPHPEFEIAGLLTETGHGPPEGVDGGTTLDELISMFDETAIATGIGVLGNLDDLEPVLAAEAIDTVIVAVRRNRLELFSRLSAYPGDITVQELPAFSEHVFGRVPVDVINAAWFMHMIHPFYRPYSRAVKRVADLLASAVIGLCALPVVPLVALAVKLTSSGPALYSQTRVGEHGREFRIYKFRTMRTDAEADGDAVWAQHDDPRVTPIGGFLRSTRLDEIPQLWNILRGHMSFVGPRPERPQFVTELEHVVPYYQRRHMVKPGLTGWAQVRLGYSDSVDGAANKLGYELYYLKHQSLFLDFVIFIETIRVVFMRFGSR